MRISHAIFVVAMFCSPSAVFAAQLPAAAPAQAAPPAPLHPSALLQPALDTVEQSVRAVKLERWKRGSIRDEAGDNIRAILRDLQDNLPPLLREADAAPGAISKVLPVSRNIDALYDVLLRVVEASRVAAPGEQITPLQQALIGLGEARRVLEDRLQEAATAQEKQIVSLQTTMQSQAADLHALKIAPPPAPCVPPAPKKKIRKKHTAPAKTPQKSQAPATGTPKPSK